MQIVVGIFSYKSGIRACMKNLLSSYYGYFVRESMRSSMNLAIQTLEGGPVPVGGTPVLVYDMPEMQKSLAF